MWKAGWSSVSVPSFSPDANNTNATCKKASGGHTLALMALNHKQVYILVLSLEVSSPGIHHSCCTYLCHGGLIQSAGGVNSLNVITIP